MEILIIGAGLSGLSCAQKLSAHGIRVNLVDSEDRVGGRIKTDVVQGFRLDRGFQVVFTGYPEFKRMFDLNSLKLRAFRPGARVKWNERSYMIDNSRPFETLLSPLFGIKDKLLVAGLTEEFKRLSLDEISELPNISVNEFLLNKGFSDSFIERFARPFFGGITLDRSLSSSSRWFAFIWKMLSEGETSIPELGMEEIPKQLASKLVAGSIRCNTSVQEILRRDGMLVAKLSDGSIFSADRIVIATDSATAARLSGSPVPTEFRPAAVHYFETTNSIEAENIIILNADPQGISQEIVPMSTVSPKLAPKGRNLVAVTSAGENQVNLASLILELAILFPNAPSKDWRHIKSYHIPIAQLIQSPKIFETMPQGCLTSIPGVILAGEPQASGSINGALRAGQLAAEYLIKDLHSS